MSEYLEFQGISKAYPGVQALSDISFRAEAGRVLALLGENGAGKSTLLKILSGDIRPDAGGIVISGEEMSFPTPRDAILAGVSVIYQERQLVPLLSVMENIFPGALPKTALGIDKNRLRAEAKAVIGKFGLPIDPDEPVGRLSVAYQQMVEIMKAYTRNSRIIAFDEPTAPLTDTETDILFRLIGDLKAEGKIIIYVSHRMAEIFKITDDVVVLKDGKFVKAMRTQDTDERALIQAMVGRDIGDTYSNLSRNEEYGDVLLEVRGLCTDALDDVSFSLRRGEVLGLAGLVGAGRTEVVRAIFGADAIEAGEIIFEGKQVRFTEPRDAIRAGIALCPEDRKEQGLILSRSVRENVTMPVLSKLKKGLFNMFLDRDAENRLTQEVIDQFTIRTPSINKIARELSGGNQQKVILGRWTNEKVSTKLLILDEPTKGIDVATKAEIYQMVCDFAKAGFAVIFISSELTEVINVSDRIIVMHNGHITGEVMRQEATEENVLALAMLD
ncbi:MAG: sugar ABC transporter ATP-binding protein [Oscillospiraceae bacterium]|jgi:ABC-type sugar transport system ATPase subunit|nr:sugar ABC transporter ATP-binding protein [Oscillospiraceae bacterium]